jgi:hypothetical protein
MPRIMELTPPVGVRSGPYPVWRDYVYRAALTLAAVALLGIAIVPTGPGSRVADGALGLATLVAAWTFFVWIPGWRMLVAVLGILGIGLATGQLWLWAEGAWLAALSVMAAKEAHCFRYAAGRVFPAIAFLIALLDVIGAPAAVRQAGFAVLFGLFAWLVAERWRLPFMQLRAEALR